MSCVCVCPLIALRNLSRVISVNIGHDRIYWRLIFFTNQGIFLLLPFLYSEAWFMLKASVNQVFLIQSLKLSYFPWPENPGHSWANPLPVILFAYDTLLQGNILHVLWESISNWLWCVSQNGRNEICFYINPVWYLYAHKLQQYDWLVNIFQDGGVILQLILQHCKDITKYNFAVQGWMGPTECKKYLASLFHW